MSLKKFFARFWAGIKKIFAGLDKQTKKLVPVAIEIVNKIKEIDATHIGDILTAIIPGTVDDKIKVKLREWLPKVLVVLESANEAANIEDVNEKLKFILSQINVSPADKKKVFYRGLASLILEVIADGKVTWSESTALIVWYYDNYKEIEADEMNVAA